MFKAKFEVHRREPKILIFQKKKSDVKSLIFSKNNAEPKVLRFMSTIKF